MYVILVYDIAEKRVSKVMTICRKYLWHVQRSVFEGELEQPKFIKFQKELKKVIDESHDQILIYKFKYLPKSFLEKELIGSGDVHNAAIL